jgi:hypothetical protein
MLEITRATASRFAWAMASRRASSSTPRHAAPAPAPSEEAGGCASSIAAAPVLVPTAVEGHLLPVAQLHRQRLGGQRRLLRVGRRALHERIAHAPATDLQPHLRGLPVVEPARAADLLRPRQRPGQVLLAARALQKRCDRHIPTQRHARHLVAEGRDRVIGCRRDLRAVRVVRGLRQGLREERIRMATTSTPAVAWRDRIRRNSSKDMCFTSRRV